MRAFVKPGLFFLQYILNIDSQVLLISILIYFFSDYNLVNVSNGHKNVNLIIFNFKYYYFPKLKEDWSNIQCKYYYFPSLSVP